MRHGLPRARGERLKLLTIDNSLRCFHTCVVQTLRHITDSDFPPQVHQRTGITAIHDMPNQMFGRAAGNVHIKPAFSGGVCGGLANGDRRNLKIGPI